MVYSLSYRRPSHTSSSASLNGERRQKSSSESIDSGSGSSCMSNGIPGALSFDRIISGGTCPPCTARDFMNFLKYVERDAENLQFYLWFLDYQKRFNALPEKERALSPEWTQAQVDADADALPQGRLPKINSDTHAIFNGTDFANGHKVSDNEKSNPFHTPSHSPENVERGESASFTSTNEDEKSTGYQSSRAMYGRKAEGAFDDAGLKWQPFSVQPYREEISRIITIYMAEGGARELNISARERASVLHALENTTHPSSFRAVINSVEWSLRAQAHPNFIRWTIRNGNRPRVIFARGLGVTTILLGIVADLLITLSKAGRAWRVLPLVLYVVGISTLIAAWKGMCVVLHGMHHRHLSPWELFEDPQEAEAELKNPGNSAYSFGSSNSWEDEPWVPKYAKRNIVRKVFDREVWIQEPALRQIQDTIFIQSLLGAFLGGFILTGIFCAVPHGNFF